MTIEDKLISHVKYYKIRASDATLPQCLHDNLAPQRFTRPVLRIVILISDTCHPIIRSDGSFDKMRQTGRQSSSCDKRR